ncbi:YitT family protein [Caulobacter sp. CCNWLY153]|nr:YitT family protein [Caulobacter radicis]
MNAAAASSVPPMPATRHTLIEDVHALLIGTSFIAVGLTLLKTAGLVTGGIAGIALIVSYLGGWPVGVVFFVLNLPFYIFAQRALGWTFAFKTLAVNVALTGLTLALPYWLKLKGVDPIFAAVFGGTIIGMGILALARHRASVGGIGVLGLWLQEKHGISAGKVQMGTDVLVVGAAFMVVSLDKLLLSILSAVALSVVIIANHKPGRYAGY